MKTITFSCDDCGVTSPPIDPSNAARVRKAHRCGKVCIHCGWRTQGKYGRGLCQTCWLSDARHDYPPRFGRRGADLIEDVEWLADDGLGLGAVLRRLNVKSDTLHKALCRADRRDLWWRLADREPDVTRRRAGQRRRAAA